MQQSQPAFEESNPGHESGAIPRSSLPMVLSDQDIETLTELVLARFQSADAEATRIVEIRQVLGAASELQRALQIHTHYMLVDHRGTPGFNDLRSASQLLLNAFEDYTRALHKLSSAYRDFPIRGPIQAADAATELSFPLDKVGGHANDAS